MGCKVAKLQLLFHPLGTQPPSKGKQYMGDTESWANNTTLKTPDLLAGCSTIGGESFFL